MSQAPEIARTAMQEVTQERERQRQQEREQQLERALQQRERTDDDTCKPKPGGRGADLGQERDGAATSRQPERDYNDMGY